MAGLFLFRNEIRLRSNKGPNIQSCPWSWSWSVSVSSGVWHFADAGRFAATIAFGHAAELDFRFGTRSVHVCRALCGSPMFQATTRQAAIARATLVESARNRAKPDE